MAVDAAKTDLPLSNHEISEDFCESLVRLRLLVHVVRQRSPVQTLAVVNLVLLLFELICTQ